MEPNPSGAPSATQPAQLAEADAARFRSAFEEFSASTALFRMAEEFLTDEWLAPCHEMREEFKRTLPVSSRAAFMLGACSTEVALRIGLLRPLVAGMVHSSTVAERVGDGVLLARDHGRLFPFLRGLIRDLSIEDPFDQVHEAGGKKLANEIDALVARRNVVVHTGCSVSVEEAVRAGWTASRTINAVQRTMMRLLYRYDRVGKFRAAIDAQGVFARWQREDEEWRVRPPGP